MSQKPYELKLDGCGSLQSAELHWELDAAARLVVRTSVSSKQRTDLTFGGLPKTADLKCQGKSLFSGKLHTVRAQGLNILELEYRDSLDLLARTFESEFLKNQTVEDFLGEQARLVGLRPRFFPRFSQPLPGLDLGGQSYLDHLRRLSSEYGFHFTVHSASGEMLFIALGAYRESVSVKAPEIGDLRSVRTASTLFGSAEVRSFDSQQGQATKSELGIATIYEPLGFLKEAGSFDSKTKWAMAGGRMEAVAGSAREPQKFRDSLALQLSKRASESEILTFTVKEPIAAPGDRIELSECAEKALDGKYLVSKVRTRIATAVPIHEITVIRA